MTDEELKRIRDRCEAATPPPWHTVKVGHNILLTDGPGYDGRDLLDARAESISIGVQAYANAKFCRHAREDVPALLMEIERLTRERDEALDFIRRRVHCDVLKAYSYQGKRVYLEAERFLASRNG